MELRKTLYRNLNRDIRKDYLPQGFLSFSSFILGSLMVITGGTFGLVYSFHLNLLAVFTGFIAFVTGYRICQKSLHQELSKYSVILSPDYYLNKTKLFELSFFLMGGLIFSKGFVELGRAISTISLESGLLSGFLIISGYVLAHIGVNKSVI